MKGKSLSLLEDNRGEHIYDIWISKDFLDKTKEALMIKRKQTDKRMSLRLKVSAGWKYC